LQRSRSRNRRLRRTTRSSTVQIRRHGLRSRRTSIEVSFSRAALRFFEGRWLREQSNGAHHREDMVDMFGTGTLRRRRSLGGLSGAPLWTLVQTNIFSWRLAGVILRVQQAIRAPVCPSPGLHPAEGQSAACAACRLTSYWSGPAGRWLVLAERAWPRATQSQGVRPHEDQKEECSTTFRSV
jgi:hypothetical protein